MSIAQILFVTGIIGVSMTIYGLLRMTYLDGRAERMHVLTRRMRRIRS
jgi:hypothetical protein